VLVPSEGKSDDTKDSFYEEPEHKKIFIGYYNAKLGADI
jgi:hypothetical protein